MQIGVLGLGAMGFPIAEHILKHFPLSVYNRSSEKSERLRARGVCATDSPADLAAHSDILLVSVSDDRALQEVVFGARGVCEGVRRGTVVIDLSTVSPQSAQNTAVRLVGFGSDFLDAPVSGGVVGAERGALIALVGGATSVLDRVRPVFATFCSTVEHCGDHGAGQRMKLLNQILVAINTLAAAETLAAGRELGLDLGQVVRVLSQGYGQSRVFAELGLRMTEGEFGHGFKAALLKKDLEIAKAELLLRGTCSLRGVEHVLRLLEQTLRKSSLDCATQSIFRECLWRPHHAD